MVYYLVGILGMAVQPELLAEIARRKVPKMLSIVEEVFGVKVYRLLELSQKRQ